MTIMEEQSTSQAQPTATNTPPTLNESEVHEPVNERTETTEQTQGVIHAGFWIRLLASIIDWIILFLIGFLVGAGSVSGSSYSVNYNGWRIIIPLAYVLVFWIVLGATPGKLVCGLRIVNANGEKLKWTKALLRFVGYFVSGIILFIGFFWIGFDKKKQGIHDKIAKTIVAKRRSLPKNV